MGAYSARHALGVGAVTLCSLLAACGDEGTSPARREGTSPQGTAETPATPQPAEIPPAPTRAEVAPGARVERALREIESGEIGERRRGVEQLLASGFGLRDLVQLAFRAARWDREKGLLADLLCDHPKEVLPLVLHRIGHGAPIHRAQVCAALGRVRQNLGPAVAVLLVRALLDEFEGTRVAARRALAHVSIRGPEIVRLHERAFTLRADGAVGGLLSSAILGPHPDGAYVDALTTVLIYELRRFPGHDSFAVARLLAETAGDSKADAAAGRIRTLLREEDLYGPTVIRLLTGAGREGLALIRSHLEDGVLVGETLEALAVMGPDGASLVRAVLPYLEQPAHRRRVMRCLWHMQAREEAVQVALFEFWLEHQSSAAREPAADAALLLRLMRPGPAVLRRVETELAGARPGAARRATLVGYLGWSAPSQRAHAIATIETWLLEKRSRVDRMIGRKNLALLRQSDAKWLELIRRSRAEAAWLQTWRRQ